MALKVLHIGGTGQISFDCVHESVRAGCHTFVFNRATRPPGGIGRHHQRPIDR